MKLVFADAFFWIASVSKSDDYYNQVNQTFLDIQPCKLVTTDSVIGELLAFYANSGAYYRRKAAALTESIYVDSNVQALPQTRQAFLEGIQLYKARPDKGYSLVDCISMNIMKRLEISEVLTRDKHFSQEGFTVLFQQDQ